MLTHLKMITHIIALYLLHGSILALHFVSSVEPSGATSKENGVRTVRVFTREHEISVSLESRKYDLIRVSLAIPKVERVDFVDVAGVVIERENNVGGPVLVIEGRDSTWLGMVPSDGASATITMSEVAWSTIVNATGVRESFVGGIERPGAGRPRESQFQQGGLPGLAFREEVRQRKKAAKSAPPGTQLKDDLLSVEAFFAKLSDKQFLDYLIDPNKEIVGLDGGAPAIAREILIKAQERTFEGAPILVETNGRRLYIYRKKGDLEQDGRFVMSCLEVNAGGQIIGWLTLRTTEALSIDDVKVRFIDLFKIR